MKKILFLAALVIFLGIFAVESAAITLTNPLAAGGVNSIQDLIAKITAYVLTVIGALATLMLVWAGILFVASAGSPETLGKAKQALKWAIIGLVIALAGTGLITVIQEVIGTPA